MHAGNQHRQTVTPVEADCQIIRLPTIAGLSHDADGWETNSTMEMWDALAEAVMSDEGFNEEAFERKRGSHEHMAEVIDLDSYRHN